ncbi:MAG: DNA-deoxyinosine glycosylase [Thiomicrorhabdus sp.]|nr:DNA-deoxyinosine glycosylase [Thiomicrorhabdus sp.]
MVALPIMVDCAGFSPILSRNPKVLILGTMPSVVSLDQKFYYAHPRNAFWPIIESFVGHALVGNQEKGQACHLLGICLWDVLQACQRQGSLDSAIQSPVANDFALLFKQYPTLNTIGFNGKTAEKLFQKEVVSVQRLPQNLTFISLPSTSPAYAAITLEDKRLLWQEKLSHLL